MTDRCLCCGVCQNHYECDELSELYGYAVCIYCVEDWQKEKAQNPNKIFEKWVIIHRKYLEAEKENRVKK